ncbi:MAG: LytR/AlgR family response regulator transcription factor [Luteibaculum sp.]
MRALIVDDELHSCEVTAELISQYCPSVEVLGYEQNPIKALTRILTEKPELLFLDIEMPQLNGVELVEKLEAPIPAIIFTTAYDQFALKAIKLGAIDYLLKPIDELELIKAVQRASERIDKDKSEILSALKDLSVQPEKLTIGTMEGVEWVAFNEIIRCQSHSNYTTIYTTDGKITASKTLKEIEAQLPTHLFFRVHNSHVVNLEKAKRFLKGIGGTLVMENGDEIPVSRNRKAALIQKLKI